MVLENIDPQLDESNWLACQLGREGEFPRIMDTHSAVASHFFSSENGDFFEEFCLTYMK